MGRAFGSSDGFSRTTYKGLGILRGGISAGEMEGPARSDVRAAFLWSVIGFGGQLAMGAIAKSIRGDPSGRTRNLEALVGLFEAMKVVCHEWRHPPDVS